MRRVFEDLSREEFGEPVDVFAVTRDDELLDWLGAVDLDAEPAPPAAQDPADAELIEMLLAWRRSVTTDASEPALPRPPRAADAPGRRPAGRLRRVPVTSAVLAVLMVCIGLGVAVQDAVPGDPLWGVSKALNSGRAASIETTAQTRRYLDVAHTELLLGHHAAAAAALAAAQQQIAQMRSDDDKRELQARQRELTNRLNRTTPAPSQVSGSGAAAPSSRRREDSATSVLANEQQPHPSRSPFPQAAAPAGTPSTTTEPSMPDEPETGTPDSSGAGSDTPRPSRSATEPSESAAVVAGPHVEPSRDTEHPPSDQPRSDEETAAAMASGSAQPLPTSGTPRSGSAGGAADADSDSRDERHAESSPPSSATDSQPQPHRLPQPQSQAQATPTLLLRRRLLRSRHPGAPRPPCTAVSAELDIEFGGRSRRDGTAQGQDCPRPPPHIPAYGHARPSPLHGLWPSRYERQSGVRPHGCHGHRRLLRATQQRDIPQLR